MSCYVAVAVSQGRRVEWERVFGTHRVPLLDGRPRVAELREGPVLVYDVAMAALHPGQLARVAGYTARRRRVAYDEAQAWLRLSGLIIRAEGVVIETADAVHSMGRLRLGNVYASSSWPRLPRAWLP